MDDRQIVDLYFARDERAIKETDNKYGRLCRRIAFDILHSREDAEECVNDTYAGVWNAIPPTRPNDLTAFICKIARNLSLKRLAYLTREKRAPEMLLSLDELAEVLPDDRFAPHAGDGDVGRAIDRFLRTQTAEVRGVFIRRYFYFEPIAAIAGQYGFTQSKVKNMLFTARKRLKTFLIKEGIEC